MTDSDIIQALECCLVTGQCKAGCFVDVLECEPVLFGAVQDLIKRQQAEIERLTEEINSRLRDYKELVKQHLDGMEV